MGKEILFTVAQDNSYNTTSVPTKLEGLHKMGFGEYYDGRFLEEYIARVGREGKREEFSFSWYPQNAPGEWMSQNIRTPNQVIPEPITLDRVKEKLGQGTFSHLVISIYLSGYSTFRDISRYVRSNHPDVKIIASSVGALLPESQRLADYLLKGDLVGDLRELLQERRRDPLKVVTVRSDTETVYKGQQKRSSYALLISSLGCWYGCDFCPSTAQFGTNYSAPFSAEQIRAAIIQAHGQIAPDSDEFTISVAEPQGLGNIKLWKRVFDLCRDLPFACNLVSTTSSKVIDSYTADELTQGSLRLGTVNIGVESLLRGYKKNQGVELKKVFTRLQNAGINVVSTFIIGLDWHDPRSIREEVRLLKALESSGYIVANLKMKPGTPLYNKYQAEGRLLDVPPELLSFYGYQAFLHPQFRPGFNDMLPLLGEIEVELSSGDTTLARNLDVFLNRRSIHGQRTREEIATQIEVFRQNLDLSAYSDGGASAVQAYAADLYFRHGFRQIDLFHPFILSTN